MALFRRSLNRCIPLILALVVLVGILPVAQASAAETDYMLDGVWVFNDTLDWPTASLGATVVSFSSNGHSFTSMTVAVSALRYKPTVGDLDQGLVANSTGSATSWVDDAWKVIHFGASKQIVDEAFYTWFTANAKPVDETSVKALVLDGVLLHYHTDLWECQGEIVDEAVVFTCQCGDLAYSWAGATISTTELSFSDDDYDYYFSDDGQLSPIGLDVTRYVSHSTAEGGSVQLMIDGVKQHSHRAESDVSFYAYWIDSDSILFDCSECLQDYTYNYSGSGTFGGFKTLSGSIVPDEVSSFNVPVNSSLGLFVYDDASASSLTATFFIGDQIYVFEGTADAAPEVTMDVISSGVRLYSGSTSYFYENASALGYKLSESADSYIAAGETYVFSSSSSSYRQTLYPVYPADMEFSTRVNIYNSSGTQLLGSYDFISQGSAPVVTLTVLGNGCKLVSGDTVYSWDTGSDPFYGLSPAMYVAAPYYVPGNVYTLPGGDAVNMTINLFVHDTESSGLPAMDFVEWLKVAVGGFLDFEIFPGMSLDEILYFILVVQLLLWFLKVIS